MRFLTNKEDKMTFKEKLKSYNFWISLVSAIILILNILGDKFNFSVDPNLIIDLSTALCSIFVILGIVSIPKPKSNTNNNTFSETTEKISNDIKDSLSNLINKSSLSVSIKEALSSFIEFKENLSNMFNNNFKKDEEETNKNEELLSEEETKSTQNNDQEENVNIVNQEVSMGFHSPEITNNISTESSISVETYNHKAN